MIEGLENLGGDSPDKWTTKELEELVTACFTQQTLADNAMAVSEKHREEQRELERKIQSYLEYYGKSKYVSSIGTIEVRERFSFRTPKTDEEKKFFFDWLTEKGLFLRYASVNSNALNSLLKDEFEEAREAGKEITVPGIQKPTEYRTIHLKRSK